MTHGRRLAGGAVAALVAVALAVSAAPATGHADSSAGAKRRLHLFTGSCDTAPNPNTSRFEWRRGDDSPKEANHLALVADLVPRACAAAASDESRSLDVALADVGRLAFDFKETNPDAHLQSFTGSGIRLLVVTPDPNDPQETLVLTVSLVGALCNHPMAGHPRWGQAHFTTDKRGCTIVVDDGSDFHPTYSADGTSSAWSKLLAAYPQGRVEASSFWTGTNSSQTRQISRYDRISIGTGVVWSRGNWGTLIRGL
jgi:hypothetical protein